MSRMEEAKVRVLIAASDQTQAWRPRVIQRLPAWRRHALIGADLTLRWVLLGTGYWLLAYDKHGLWIVGAMLMALAAVTLVATQFHEFVHQNININRACRLMGLVSGGAPLGLLPSWWLIKHRQHHRFPGHPYLDPDIQFDPLGRIRASQQWRPHYRLQFITLMAGFPFVTLNMLRPTDVATVHRKTGASWSHLLAEKYVPFFVFWTPLLILTGSAGLGRLLAFELMAGTYGGIVAQLQHNTYLNVKTSRNSRSSFAKIQISKTSDTKSATAL